MRGEPLFLLMPRPRRAMVWVFVIVFVPSLDSTHEIDALLAIMHMGIRIERIIVVPVPVGRQICPGHKPAVDILRTEVIAIVVTAIAGPDPQIDEQIIRRN